MEKRDTIDVSTDKGYPVDKLKNGISNFFKNLPFWILIVSFIGTVLGMVLAVFFSAFGEKGEGFWPGGFTVEWFLQAWERYDVGLYTTITLQIIVPATLISIVLSIPTAYVLGRREFPFKNALVTFFKMPFTLPELVYAIPVAAIFYSIGLAETIPGLVIVYLIIGIPFSVSILVPAMETLDPRLEWAALSLGADRKTMFIRVIMPQLVSAITAAALNVFVRIFGTFTLTLLIAGATSQTLPLMVFSVLQGSGTQPQALLDSLTIMLMIPMLIFSFATLWLQSFSQKRFGK